MSKITFSLFRNDKKTGNQPDYRSPMKTSIIITEPGEYRVAGWKKETKEGQAYLSCMLEKVVPGQDHGPTREQNVALIQETRQRLEGHHPVIHPPLQRPAPQGQQRQAPYRPPQVPNADDLPF